MASRDLNDLSPHCRELAIKFQAGCIADGLDILIYCTYRSSKEQDELYACGRTKVGKKVTNCRGGQSNHNHVDALGKPAADAFDFVPMLHGKPQWGDAVLYGKAGKIAESVGLRWAGRWTGSLKETAHCEI
jgi:peptidoglycan L-alanyl-D-glutamate endopeptidase CwlK